MPLLVVFQLDHVAEIPPIGIIFTHILNEVGMKFSSRIQRYESPGVVPPEAYVISSASLSLYFTIRLSVPASKTL